MDDRRAGRAWFERSGGRITVALIAVSLLAAGCAGSSESGSPSATEPAAGADASADAGTDADSPATSRWGDELDESSFAPQLISTVDALIATHGDATLDVLLFALERGYTAAQIERGAADGAIAGDGSFTDGTAPDGPSAGVIELPGDTGDDEGGDGDDQESAGIGDGPVALRAAQPDEAPLTVDRLRRSYAGTGAEPDRVLALFIVGLVRDGYSLEQITDAIVLGTGVPFPAGDFEERHICLFDPTGVLILPAVPIGENPICADSTIGRSPDAAPATSDASADPVAEPATGDGSDDSEFERARYVAAGALSESGDGSLFGELGEGGGDDGPESEVLIDVAEFVAGDTLDGGIELLANLNVLGELDCFYLSYQFEDVALVGDGTQTYAGSGTAEGAFPDEPCTGTSPPGGLQTGAIDVAAVVVGDELRITLSAEGEDEPLTVTATRVDD